MNMYEITDEYIEYMHQIDEKVSLTKEDTRSKLRKYIGIVLTIHGFSYFVPLSSYKPDKHDDMNEAIDFLKLQKYSVININNMIPVQTSEIKFVKFNDEKDIKYKDLLRSEYRLVKAREQEILRNSRIVYNHRTDIKNKDKSLYKRCCDFKNLEEACVLYTAKSEVANTVEI